MGWTTRPIPEPSRFALTVKGGRRPPVKFTGTAGADLLQLWPDQGSMQGDGYAVTAVHVEAIVADGLEGTDRAILSDSPGNDVLVVSPGKLALSGPGFAHTGAGLRTCTPIRGRAAPTWPTCSTRPGMTRSSPRRSMASS